MSGYMELIERMTAPGSPFEVGETAVRGRRMRAFTRAPNTLSHLYGALERHGDKEFIIEGAQRHSHGQIGGRAGALAAQLRDRHGIDRGDRVAIAMRNCTDWMVSFLAVSSLGGVPALVNSRGTGEEMRYCVAEVEARLVIADAPRAAALRDAGLDQPMLEADAEGRLAIDGPPQRLGVTDDDPDATGLILFTSGTTGRPKGANLTHRSVITGVMHNQLGGLIRALEMGLTQEQLAAMPGPTALLAFPLFHVSGCEAMFLPHLIRGGKLVLIPPRWDAAEVLRLVEAERVSAFSGSPAMFWDMLPLVDRYDVSSVTSLSIGGQATPANLMNALREKFPRAVFGTGYGSTETNGAVCMASGRDYTDRPHTGGRVLPLTELEIRDEQGRALPVGETGDIWVRGPMVQAGYWNRPDATAAVTTPDGWFRIGDIGRLDADGFITIVDRRTDMVISGGENIYCAEVERVLSQHEAVVEAAAYGLPDERLGEKLVASIVLHPEAGLTAADIRAHVGRHLAGYKVPAEVRLEDEPLPRNASGKINKTVLRARAAAQA